VTVYNRSPIARALALVLTLGLGFALAAPAAAASARDASMGSAGELYFVLEGTYGELFPEQGLADSANRALALDVTRSDGTAGRYLVPDTETDDVEDSASVLFEDQTGTLFVLWQTKVNVIHSRLNLIGFRDGEWTELIEISGNPFGWKSAPQLAITRDTFHTEEPDGSLRAWQRTVAHLLWWETAGGGEPVAHYSPVVLLDGAYTGWNPVLRLGELEASASEGLPAALNHSLAQVPRIEAGRNGQSVAIAFVHPQTGGLITLTAEVLPGEFGVLAERVRHQIIEIGRGSKPDQPGSMSEKVRHQIIEIGNRLGLHPSVPSYAAQLAVAQIDGALPGEDPVALADKVRHQIIEIGARMTDRGYDRARATSKLQVLETSNAEASGAPPNLIRIVRASIRPAPETGEGETAMFLSHDGREVVVSWHQDGRVYYRETRGEGWSGIRSLRLGNDLDLARAYQILEQRADERASE
jgi:hypothetical protein